MEQRNILSDRQVRGRLTLDWVVRRVKDTNPTERRRSNEDASVDQSIKPVEVAPIMSTDGPLKEAAVLVPLVNRPEGLTVLLTKRTEHLANHAGQISFPGGRVDEGDEDGIATALRETQEEIGLDPHHIEVIGRLDDYVVGTGYLVEPVIAVLEPPFDITPHDGEVAAVFEPPLEFLMDLSNYQRHHRIRDEVKRHFYAITFEEYFIWGATAGMLRNLSERLKV